MKKHLPALMSLAAIFWYANCSKRNIIQFVDPFSANPQNAPRVERDYNQRKPTESYQEQYNALIAGDPEADMLISVRARDYRFVAISGYALLVPGVMENERIKIIHEQKNVKLISGTTDMIIEDWPDLQGAAYNYAVRYNKALNAFCRQNSIQICQKTQEKEYLP